MRKGIVAGELALIVIAILIGVLAIAMTVTAGSAVKYSTGEQFCKLTNDLKGAMPTGTKWTVPDFCAFTKKSIVVDADKWEECEPMFEGAPNYEEAEDTKSCVGFQIIKFALKCWDMYGRGQKEIGLLERGKSKTCYEIKLVGIKKAGINENFITKIMDEQDVCKTLANTLSDTTDGKTCGSGADQVLWSEGSINSKGKIQFNLGLSGEKRISFVGE